MAGTPIRSWSRTPEGKLRVEEICDAMRGFSEAHEYTVEELLDALEAHYRPNIRKALKEHDRRVEEEISKRRDDAGYF